MCMVCVWGTEMGGRGEGVGCRGWVCVGHRDG